MSEEEQIDLLIVPNYQYQCRMCILSKEHPELYNWICKNVKLGIPYGKISTLLTEEIKKDFPDMKPIRKKNFWNHFEKHIPVKDNVDIKVAKRSHQVKETETKRLISDVALEEIKLLREGTFDEHDELCKLYVKFREIHDQIYEMENSLQATDCVKGEKVWSQNKIQAFTGMVNTQKAILAEIAKMRQSNKLITVATQYIVETFTASVVDKLSSEFKALIDIMKRQHVDETIIAAIEDLGGTRLARMLIDEAEFAMGKTRQEFKLPN